MVDPLTLNYNWFNSFLVWRQNPTNENYDRVQFTLSNPAARNVLDVEPEAMPKDRPIGYRVNLALINGVRNPLSNELKTIQLVNTPVDVIDNLDLSLTWTPYQGWSNPIYTVQFKDEQRDFPVGWQYPETNASTTDTFITFVKPVLPGNYPARSYC